MFWKNCIIGRIVLFIDLWIDIDHLPLHENGYRKTPFLFLLIKCLVLSWNAWRQGWWKRAVSCHSVRTTNFLRQTELWYHKQWLSFDWTNAKNVSEITGTVKDLVYQNQNDLRCTVILRWQTNAQLKNHCMTNISVTEVKYVYTCTITILLPTF